MSRFIGDSEPVNEHILAMQPISIPGNKFWRLRRYRYFVGYALLVASSLLILSAFRQETQTDVALYSRVAANLMHGVMPYRDQPLEYPPYAILIFLMPQILNGGGYVFTFMALAFVVDWFVKLSLLVMSFRESRSLSVFWPLLLYCLAMPFTCNILLQRYDIFPAGICLLTVWLFCTGRYFLSGLILAIGIGVKVYPIIFLAPMFACSLRQGKAGRFGGGVTIGLCPLIIAAYFLPWWRFAEFQARRGLQVESLYASVLWLGKLLGLWNVKWEFIKAWFEVTGPLATAVLPYTRLVFALTVIFSVIFTSWAAGRYCFPNGATRTELPIARLSKLLFVPLLAFVGFNQVLSPQYMIWLMPMAVLASLEQDIMPILICSIATVMTPIIYPSLFGDYGDGLSLFETTILLIRDLILIVLWVQLIREIIRAIRPDHQRKS